MEKNWKEEMEKCKNSSEYFYLNYFKLNNFKSKISDRDKVYFKFVDKATKVGKSIGIISKRYKPCIK